MKLPPYVSIFQCPIFIPKTHAAGQKDIAWQKLSRNARSILLHGNYLRRLAASADRESRRTRARYLFTNKCECVWNFPTFSKLILQIKEISPPAVAVANKQGLLPTLRARSQVVHGTPSLKSRHCCSKELINRPRRPRAKRRQTIA